MKPQKHLLGEQGERIAAAFLQKENCTIIARNYRFGKSEIDIIAQDGSAL
ncbi:MAG: YraN family protein [Calditrichaceae bacterium]